MSPSQPPLDVARSGDAFRHTLDVIADGVVHLDQFGRVLWVNRAGIELAERVPLLKLRQGERMRTGDAAMDAYVVEICQGSALSGRPLVIDSRRHIGSLLVGHATATPAGSGSEPRVIVTLHTAGRPRDWQGLLGYFGLTPAEAALADDIIHGVTLEHCAEARGTSIHTVRNQLRALLAKTGTKRQSELVGLLAPFAVPRQPVIPDRAS
jgi:DNA-binding CsgD family transcriptional regulator